MKTIIKVLSFLLTVVLLSQCKKDETNPEVKIPDNNFLNALIELGVDTNGDGIISPAEAEAITYLDVSGTYETPGKIENLTGIEAFINLDTLDCSYNQLTTLDVSNNIALLELICYFNPLTTLDVSNNTALRRLHLEDMPSLNKVCVWELPFPPEGVYLDKTGSPNVYFTTDCN
jgi:Leucine-rich repeat (LRR) protein